MASRVIDAVLRLNDKFTAPLQNSLTAMTNCSKSAVRIGRDIEKTGNSIAGLGMAVTAAVTVPLVGIGVTATREFGEVDKNLRLIKETMGETKWATGDLEKSIKDAAQSSVFGMREATEASLNFARQGFDAKQAGELIAPALSLAAGTATDLSASTAGIGTAMKVFSLNAKEASHVASVFATAQAQANTTTTDLFEAVSTAGPIFKTVGWDIEDLASMVDVLGDAGISGSEGANALKSGLARLSGNTQAIKALDALGVSIYDDNHNMKSMVDVIKTLQDAMSGMNTEEKMFYASKLFGANQMGKWLAIINTSTDKLSAYRGALDGVKDTADNMATALMGGAGGALESLGSAFDVAKFNIGKALAGIVTPVIQGVTKMLVAFNNMSPEQQKQIIRWAMIAASVGPTLMIFGRLVALFGKGVQIFNRAGMALKAFGGIIGLVTSPVGVAIAVALALMGVIAIVITHLDEFKSAFASVSTVCAPYVEHLIEAVNSLGASLGPVITFIAELVANVLVGAFQGAGEGIALIIEGIATTIKGIANIINGVIEFIVGIATGDWSRAWEGLSGAVIGVFETIGGAIEGVVGLIDGVVGAVSGAASKVGSFVQGATSGVAKVSGGSGRKIPMNASGTDNWVGGITSINERGGEIVDLPRGTRIYPHDESLSMARQEGAKASNGHPTVTITGNTFNVRSEADIEAIGDAIVRRLRSANNNRGGWTFNGAMA